MGLVRLVAPATEPITVLETIRHLRLDETMLEPVPDAPVAALAGSGAGAVTVGAHRYRCTFVTTDGETDGGAISNVVTVADSAVDGKVALTSIPLGGSAVTARRIYRTKAGLDSYFLVATIANNTAATYTDTLADAVLGAGVPATNSTGDPVLAALIATAREHVEQYQARALITQQWQLTLDGFPSESSASMALPKPQLVSVESITYVDRNGAVQTLDPSTYVVDVTELRGLVRCAYGKCWPETRAQSSAVTVRFTCGYGDASAVPAATKHAMKLLVAHWYANREAFVESRFALEVPFAVNALLYMNRSLEAA